MKLNFYIILLLLLSFIVKADQILELIKIPNLTLYKLEKILVGEGLDEFINTLSEHDQITKLSKLGEM